MLNWFPALTGWLTCVAPHALSRRKAPPSQAENPSAPSATLGTSLAFGIAKAYLARHAARRRNHYGCMLRGMGSVVPSIAAGVAMLRPYKRREIHKQMGSVTPRMCAGHDASCPYEREVDGSWSQAHSRKASASQTEDPSATLGTSLAAGKPQSRGGHTLRGKQAPVCQARAAGVAVLRPYKAKHGAITNARRCGGRKTTPANRWGREIRAKQDRGPSGGTVGPERERSRNSNTFGISAGASLPFPTSRSVPTILRTM